MTGSEGLSSTDLTVPGEGAAPSNGDSEALRRGETVGRYVVVSPLGHGGMGVVYGAYDPDLDRKVALKLLHSDSARAWTLRLADEAKVMAKVSHPSVVSVYDVGDHGGRMFIAMEFVDGTTLREWLRSGRSQTAIVTAFARAGRGLYAAHQQGLVHRDFKPDNVMVQGEGADDSSGPRRVQVLDFGLAHVGDQDGGDTASSSGVEFGGTPGYMAPEIFGQLEATAASDQFSFCAALFEALTGQRPFAGDSLPVLVANVTHGDLQTPATFSELPRWLRRALTRGLQTDPNERWPSMDALLLELERDRKRARRLGLAAVGTGILLASVLATQQLQERRHKSACAEDGAAVATLWNEARASEVERAMLETQLPFVPNNWARARPALDTFANRWSEATTEVCVSAKVHNTAPHYELATDCLDEARISFSALIDQLVRGGASSASELAENALALRDPRTCLEPAELSGRAAAPTSAQAREAVAEVRFDIAQVAALLDVGQIAEANALANRAVATADKIDWPTIAAKARISLAAVVAEAGDPEAALALEQEAMIIAGTAGDDTTALAATLAAMFTLASDLYRPAEAMQLQHHARMLAQRARLEADDPRSNVLLNTMGVAHFINGEHSQARDYFTQYVAYLRAQLGTSHPKVASALTNLANAQAALGNVDTALQLGQEVIEIRTTELGATHPKLGSAFATMGTLLTRAGRNAEGIAYMERAVTIRSRVFGGDAPQVISVQNNIVSSLISERRFEEAVKLGAVVLAARRRQFATPNSETAGALQNLSVALRQLGRFDEATAAAAESAALTRKLFGPTHPRTVGVALTVATATRDSGDTEQAVALYRDIVETADSDPNLRLYAADARLLWASVEHNNKRYERTLALCKEVQALLPPDSQTRDLGEARLCMAGALWMLNREHVEAIALVRGALATLNAHEADKLTVWLETARADGPPPPAL